jgi:fibronectin type 3 domain-containing protein
MKKFLYGLAVFTLMLGLGFSGCNGVILGDKYGSGIFSTGPGTPPAPSNVSASYYSSGYIEVSWNSVSTASYYCVYRSTSSSGPWDNVVATPSYTYYYDYSVSSGTYYYKVSAVNSSGVEGTQSSYTSVTFGGGGPPAPGSISAYAYSSYIEVSWGSVSEASYYYVYRSTSSDGSYSYITSSSDTYYNDYSVSSGTYYYKVSSVDSSGVEGVQSSSASATFGGGSSLSGSETSTPLSSNSWTYGYISAGEVQWYRFIVTAGVTYYVQWDDDYEGSGAYSGDIKVSAYRSNGSQIFNGVDSGYNYPQSVTLDGGETVYVKVEGYNSSSSTGSYSIQYYQDYQGY